MRQSPQAPLFLGGPPSKTAYTVLDSLSGRFGVKTFFFFFFWRTPWFWKKKREIRDEIEVKTFFFFREHLHFENSCLGPLNWNIHHWTEYTWMILTLHFISEIYVKFCSMWYQIWHQHSRTSPKNFGGQWSFAQILWRLPKLWFYGTFRIRQKNCLRFSDEKPILS